MSESARFLLATLCGIVLAAIIHIVVILRTPDFAENDAFSNLRHTLTEDHAVIISAPGADSDWLPQGDPSVVVAACAFDLSEGPSRISARVGGAAFESLSFHAQGGTVFLLQGWHTVGKVRQQATWDPEKLGPALKAELAKGLTAKESMASVMGEGL